ncbi:MAG TPA: ABC transporter permease [Planctomycetota bacterium]|nr:ABC transporter permease [Planctomycetota bacterium]
MLRTSHFVLRTLLWPSVLLAGTFLLLWLTVKLAAPQQNSLHALSVLWNGAFGSLDALASTTARALILILYALGITLSFRAGLLNIGAEGQSRIGACLAAAVALSSLPGLESLGVLGVVFVLLAGAFAGALWSLIPGLLREWRGVPEVISTLMLNFVALLFARYLVSSPDLLRGQTIFQQSDPIADALQLKRWDLTDFHSAVWLAIPAVLLAHLVLFHTRFGFQLRATGLNQTAAEASGIDTRRISLRTFAIAGALAGLAGAISLLARGRLEADPAYPDYGYMAIAVALMANLKPLYVFPAAIVFAGLEVGTRAMEINAGVSHDVVYAIEGVIILAILIRGVQVLRKRASTEASAAQEAAS